MIFLGYQKTPGGEILAAVWNVTRGPAKGTTMYFDPEATRAERAALLREKKRQFRLHTK